MVLADSVEPLHYPAIMFSSPSAPRLPHLPPVPSPLTAHHQPNTHTTTNILHHSSSSALSLSIPLFRTGLFLPSWYSSLSIHPPALSTSFLFSLSLSLFLFMYLFLSPSLYIYLTPFHWSYYFFTVSCFPLSSFLPLFFDLLWFIGFTAMMFWQKLYCQNKTSLTKVSNNILCIQMLSRR